jgi:hypothetical protein
MILVEHHSRFRVYNRIAGRGKLVVLLLLALDASICAAFDRIGAI